MQRIKLTLSVLCTVLGLVWMAVPAVAQTCGWASGFHQPGIPGFIGTVRALTIFDDGTGPALYIGGQFTFAGGVRTNHIAKWDGTQWSPLGSGVGSDSEPQVFALTVFDDGTGPALYVGGRFTMAGGVAASGIAKWNGTQWSPVGGGVNGIVYALMVFDDEAGSALYVGGSFSTAGGARANSIAKWNGTQWSALGDGISGIVYALTVFDNGTRPTLYAGGQFTFAEGLRVNSIAEWDGIFWSPLGDGVSGIVFALTVFNDGTGPALYAGGHFSTAGGVVANSTAKWNGTQWSALGSGMGGPRPYVYALTVFNDGTGPALYVGGVFTMAGGAAANRIAKWNGTQWSAFGSGISDDSVIMYPSVYALLVFDDGASPTLYAGGEFTIAGGVAASRIAKWSGNEWSALGSGNGMNSSVRVLTVFDDGAGAALYAGGEFTTAGGVVANRIAKWNSTQWSPLGGGMSADRFPRGVDVLTVFDDGTGPALYAGGHFTTAGDVVANYIAKWDGTQWSPLGSGMSGGSPFTAVGALTVFDDGTGPALYAGGHFTTAGGVVAYNIAKWDGTQWSPVGGGIRGGIVLALTVFDDGTGPALYAGGGFIRAGGVEANSIAKWNGTQWSPLGSGMNSGVWALTVFDDGTGPALYAGGDFTMAGGVEASRIAKWDGTKWSPVGVGVSALRSPYVNALTVFDDGTGPALYVGGQFTFAGGVRTNHIAKWNGTQWSPLGNGMDNPVLALTMFDDRTGPALYAGGFFITAGGLAANYIAKWSCTMP